MATVEYFAALDLVDEGALETGWRIKQGDYGNSIIRIQILQDGAVVYDANNPPTIVFKRPDGKSVVGAMTADSSTSTYTHTISGSELQLAGIVVMDVKYQGTLARESTLSCRFLVIPDTLSSDATPADVYVADVTLEEIEEDIEKIETAGETALTEIEEAKENALTEVDNSTKLAESWAIGGTGKRGGEDTDNSKYYAEQSENAYKSIKDIMVVPNFILDFNTGHLTYEQSSIVYDFTVDSTTGHLKWEVVG